MGHRREVQSSEHGRWSELRELTIPRPLVGEPQGDWSAIAQLMERPRHRQGSFSRQQEPVPVGIALTNLSDGRLVGANEPFLDLFDVTREQAIGRTSLELGISFEAAQKHVRAELERHGAVRDLQVTRYAANGAQLTLSLSQDRVKVAGEEHVLTTVVDLTARHRAREEVARLIEMVPALICTLGADGALEMINREWTAVLGHPPEDLLGYGYLELVHPEDLDATLREIRARLDGGGGADFVNRYRARDGSYRTLEWNATLGEDGRLYGCARDVTRRVEEEESRAALEAQLQQARKMEAIGTLAGGVAHDFNNILGGLLVGLSLLEVKGKKQAPELLQEVQEMKALVQRGADLARQLLGLGRRGKYVVRPLDLASVVGKTLEMFRRTRNDVTISLTASPALRAVLMDHAQLEQVVINVLTNACQAMPDGGRIDIRAENAELDAGELGVAGLRPGSYVRLSIADTGIGIEHGTQARIFEPFFTTKAPGHGTGLGLASVYGIIRNHGGAIAVESDPGRGATFAIVLPATEHRPSDAAPVASEPRRGKETILVVDDERMLRELCARMLRAMGYEVLVAAGGREAVALLQEHGARIALVILDLTMPEMSGTRTFEALREVSPDVKVLLASGHSVEGQAELLLARGCNGFIQKPFDAAKLSESLEALL